MSCLLHSRLALLCSWNRELDTGELTILGLLPTRLILFLTTVRHTESRVQCEEARVLAIGKRATGVLMLSSM